MSLQEITKDLGKQTEYRLDQRFDTLLRRNPRYRHLDSGDQQIIKDLLEKYKEKKRKGISISGLSVRRDMYSLYHNRIKLGLTLNDLDDIRDLLTSLKD